MSNIITTGQLYEEYQQMNQKLEQLNNKIDGIIDGSTPANTQVTGSNVELIKKYDYETEGYKNNYFGNDVRSGPEGGGDLDVSQYRKISIAVKNNTDKEFNIRGLFLRIANEERDMERYAYINVDLPAGSETTLNGFEHSDIDDIHYLDNNEYPYVRLRVLNNDGIGEGNIQVAFLGVR